MYCFIFLQIEEVPEVSYILFFLLTAVLTQGLIWVVAEKMRKQEDTFDIKRTACSGVTVVYIITNAFLTLALLGTGCFVLFDNQYMIHIVAGLYLVICVGLYALVRKTQGKWLPYWFGSFFVLSMYWFGSFFVWLQDIYNEIGYGWQWWRLFVTLLVFGVAKLMAKRKELKMSELLISLYTAWLAVWTFAQLDLDWHGRVVEQGEVIYNFVASICFLSAFLLSVLALNHWKLLYEEIILSIMPNFIVL